MSIDYESPVGKKSPSTLKKWGGIALISFAVAMTPVTSFAADLKRGQCGSVESIINALEADGQQRIAVSNAMTKESPVAEAIYSNTDGSKGTRILADKPRGEKPTKVCVANILTDITINDAKQPGVPTWAKIGGDEKAALAACKKISDLGICGAHDNTLDNAEKNSGQRVMLQARTLVGTQPGPLLTITYNPTNNEGTVLESFQSTGTASLARVLTDVQYTDVGYAMIGKKKIITAAVAPETETASIIQPISLTTTLQTAPTAAP